MLSPAVLFRLGALELVTHDDPWLLGKWVESALVARRCDVACEILPFVLLHADNGVDGLRESTAQTGGEEERVDDP